MESLRFHDGNITDLIDSRTIDRRPVANALLNGAKVVLGERIGGASGLCECCGLEFRRLPFNIWI